MMTERQLRACTRCGAPDFTVPLHGTKVYICRDDRVCARRRSGDTTATPIYSRTITRKKAS